MYYLRRLTIFSFVLAGLVFLTWFLPRALNPTPPSPEDRLRDKKWINSSPHWVDRQLCRYVSLCGVQHVRWDSPSVHGKPNEDELRRLELRSTTGWGRDWSAEDAADATDASADVNASIRGWEEVERMSRRAKKVARGEEKKPDNRTLKEIPDYVLRYAPLVHLYSKEFFWPSDIAEHIQHTEVFINGSLLNLSSPLTLSNLRELDFEDGPVYLTSDDDVEDRPKWLYSDENIPTPFNQDGEWGDDDEDPEYDDRYSHTPEDNNENSIPHSEGTTWFEVDRKHPLKKISDPRKFIDHRLRPLKPRFHGGEPGDFQRRRVAASNLPPQYPRVSSFSLSASRKGHKPDESGYSKAPAVLVVVDKGSDILDAFWFFFYSYNLGQTVLDIRFGNHVGDWEHCMVRFENGVPRALSLSQHEGGQAYAWSALEKWWPLDSNGNRSGDGRPVIYSAVGSHAMYATPGLHPYVLPFKMLKDITDKGPLWDPAMNQYAYFYDYEAEHWERVGSVDFAAAHAQNPPSVYEEAEAVEPDTSVGRALLARRSNPQPEPTSLTPAASNPDAPTSWFHFEGAWGDETYGLGDRRQWRLFGQYHYLTGPFGPKFKNLAREKVCFNSHCRILYDLEAGKKATWYS